MQHRIIEVIKEIMRKLLIAGYHILRPFIPVKKDMLIFDSSTGSNYTGSPRAVYERMVELGLDQKYDCVWMFQKGKAPKDLPGTARQVRFMRPAYFLAMSRAHVWIFDARQPEYIRKKRKQKYIQIWHGTPLKKLALDMDIVSMAGTHDIAKYRRSFLKNASRWDYLVAQNDFSAEIFKRCFAFHKEILRIGYPRNDVLFSGNAPDYIARLKTELGLPSDKRLLLYAPTWRDDEYLTDGSYRFSPALDFDLLQKELGNEYAVMVKYHYLVGDKIDWSKYQGFVYSFDAEAEISSLYLVADALITDYSSVMFDYSLLHRPMYFYAYDLEKYRDNLRGFYFDFLKEAPGPISQTTEELVEDILQYGTKNEREYEEKSRAFYEKYHGYDKGRASDEIIRLISILVDKALKNGQK